MEPAEIWAPITRWALRPIGMGEVVCFDVLLVMRPRPTPPCLDRVHRRMLGVPASSRADCPSGDGSRQNPRPPIMRLIASPEQEAPTRCFLWARSLEARPPPACLALWLGRRGLNPPGCRGGGALMQKTPTPGWALQAFRVAADEARTHTLHLRAWGAAPARSTHGLVHHDVPPKHTLQAAQHAAAAAALEYAKQLSAQNTNTTITLASVTTLRDLQDPDDPAAQPTQRPAGAARGKRRRLHDDPPQIAAPRKARRKQPRRVGEPTAPWLIA